MRTSEREAVAWSYVPVAASSLLWIPILLTLATRAFGDGAQPLVGVEWLGVPLMIAVGLSYGWSIPLLIGGLAAAQGFSVAKAILYFVILLVPLLILTAIG